MRSAGAHGTSASIGAYYLHGIDDQWEDGRMKVEGAAMGRHGGGATGRSVDDALKCLVVAAPEVKSAVRNVLRDSDQEMCGRYATLVAHAWQREPRPDLVGAVRCKTEAGLGEQPGAGSYVTPVSLVLSESRSGSEAASFQRSIERGESCVASFGTLGPTATDRVLAWEILGRHGIARRGWLDVKVPANRREIELVADLLDRWKAEGRDVGADITQWHDAARRRLSGEREEEEAGTVSCRVWTRSREEHKAMRAHIGALYGHEGELPAWLRDVREREPRQTVVQRRVEFRLAPELIHEARERIVLQWCTLNLEDMNWHACIHAPADGDAQGHYTVYVVYAQVEIAHRRDESGVLRNRLTMEGTRVPLVPVAHTLWGKGPGGRWKRDALIEVWRQTFARLLNDALQDARARRRYDAGAHASRGQGGVACNAQTAGTWQEVGAGILGAASAGREDANAWVAECERLRRALDVLRLMTGLDGDDQEALQLWELLAGQLLHHEPRPVETSAFILWLQAATWTFSRAAPVEPWWSRWLRALVDEVEGGRVGAVAAAIVGEMRMPEVYRLELDPRAEVRALAAQARRWEQCTARWRERLRQLRISEPVQAEELRRLVDEVEEHGLTLEDVAEGQDLKWLRKRGRLAAESVAAADAQRLIRQCTDEEGIEAEWRRWSENHEHALAELGDAGESLSAAVRTACEGAAFWAEWLSAVENAEPQALRGNVQRFLNEVNADPDGERACAWNALGPGEQEEIRRFAADPMKSIRAGRERLYQDVSTSLMQSKHGYGDPGPLSRLLKDRDRMQWLEQFEPTLHGRVHAAVTRVKHRRAATRRARESLGISAPTTQPTERARQVAQLTPTQVAGWVGGDPGLVRIEEPAEVWEVIERRMVGFGAVVRRRIAAAKKKASADSPDRDVGAVASEEELTALRLFHPEVADEIESARTRAEEQDAELVREIEQMIAHIRGTRDPEARSGLQSSLAGVLRGEQALRALPRRQWLNLARQGGLGPLEVGEHVRTRAARALDALERIA